MVLFVQKKLTNHYARLRYTNSFIVEKLNFMLPIFFSAPKCIINKLHIIYAKTARLIYGGNTFKVSNKKLSESCGWTSFESYLQKVEKVSQF